MHGSKAIFLALTAENKSTETVGADPGFRGEAGGDARGKQGYLDTPPAARMSRIWSIGVWGGAPAALQLLHF